MPPYVRVEPKCYGSPTESRLSVLGKEILALVVSGTDVNISRMFRYWTDLLSHSLESRLLIKPLCLFRRFRYFSWGVNHDPIFVCMIYVVVCIIKTVKCPRLLVGQPKNRGLISSSGAKILSPWLFSDQYCEYKIQNFKIRILHGEMSTARNPCRRENSPWNMICMSRITYERGNSVNLFEMIGLLDKIRLPGCVH